MAIPEIFTVKESREMPVGTEAGTVLRVKLMGREPLPPPPPPPPVPFGRPLHELSEKHAIIARKRKAL
jgi:hypothetical protein